MPTSHSTLRSAARYLRSWAVYLRWRILGITASPQSSEDWDREFAAGSWSFLEETAQSAHHGVIAAYALALAPSSILDVGCGQGMLAEHLKTVPYRYYLGIDYSPVAVDKAVQRHADARTGFLASDARRFQADRAFDLIVFNESLYYLGDPREILEKYARFLAPNGRFIVSIYSSPRNRAVWHAIHAAVTIDDAVTVRNRQIGKGWTIEVLSPRQIRT